ncbi:MAG TPA: GGDEF domain-containing protein [Campylobacteraceae bacterium]|nr:GGDEF domain-containing protein [Campylobacteraceae bacterium]
MRFKTFNMLVMLALFLFSVVNFYIMQQYIRSEIDKVLIDSLRQYVYNLSLHVNEHLNDPTEENLHILLDRFNAGTKEIADLYVTDEEGRLQLTTDYSHDKQFTLPKQTLSIDRLSIDNIEKTTWVMLPVYKLDGLRKVPYHIYLKLDQEYISRIMRYLNWMQLLFPLSCLLLFAGAYYLFYRLVIRPLLGMYAYVSGETSTLPRSGIAEIETLSENVERYLKALKEMAYIDPLTQVKNRRSIDNALDIAIAAAQRDGESFGIAIIDLDRFKEVNDTHGHDIGDKLLRGIMDRIKTHLRQVDQIGRLGGDEFLIIFHHDKAPQNIYDALERIRKLCEAPFHFGSVTLTCTISAGVAIYPEDAKEKVALLKYADQAMYRSKNAGGNQVH